MMRPGGAGGNPGCDPAEPAATGASGVRPGGAGGNRERAVRPGHAAGAGRCQLAVCVAR